MRAATSELESDVHEESFLGVLDQFASLHTYSGAGATVGGYRLLAPKRQAALKAANDIAATTAGLAALARARMHLTGFLSVLLFGGLGLAILAGPSTCTSCSSPPAEERVSLARLGYVDSAHLVRKQEEPSPTSEMPTLGAATVLEPDSSAAGVSAITTAALEPTRESSLPKRDEPIAASVGPLPPTTQTLADAGPTIKLAALDGAPSRVPSVKGAPPSTKVTAVDVEAVAERKDDSKGDDRDEARNESRGEGRHAHRKRVARAYRTPVAKPIARPIARSVKHAQQPGDGMVVKRAPRWAQQMYVTPWQSQAFAYTR